ncbi:MAG: deaminase [Nitrospinae bacterium]|nr:deaminase [Nitrospinota bacterium]
MTRKVFYSPKAPEPKGTYSQSISHNGILYISGQIPIEPNTGNIIRGTIEEEARATFENIKIIIEEAGSKMEDTLKVTCYLSNMDDLKGFNNIYKEYFPKDPPARTTIQAGRLPMDVKLEIDAIVTIG